VISILKMEEKWQIQVKIKIVKNLKIKDKKYTTNN
jgi:hypothetical protein